ncbi:MAG: L-fucose:H+ symporter permease [Bacteroidetes bacterium]|nr:L-fucose:H+ symporter permease [Bacteroidota bacterium]
MSKNKYLLPFALVTSLFFLWGFAISMLDVLNKHFQEVLNISIAESAWVQVATFGAYFLMALPAGFFMKKFGYKKGIIAGLLLYAGGAFLVYPASEAQSWSFFLVALFILACGLAFLETAANPYATVLGPRENSEQRLNLAQSFNGVGVITGPLVGGLFVFAATSHSVADGFRSVQLPYLIVGAVVLLVALLFYFTPMPEVEEETLVADQHTHIGKKLWQHRQFAFAVLAQFLNVGAQCCIWGFFINYTTETLGISNQDASFLQAIGMVIFMAGRFLGTLLMRYVQPHKMLGYYCVSIVALLLVVTGHFGKISVGALMAFYLFQSITFPTIFALGVKDLGKFTKNGSSYIIMGIVGGAVFPPIMGYVADQSSMATAFILPTIMFAYIAWYGFRGSQLK